MIDMDRDRLYPLHPDVPAYIMALLAEIKRLEDLILAAWYASQDVHLLVEADAIRERRKA